MALFPAIVISGILLMVTVGASQSFLSMLQRISLAENKVQSIYLARSCLLMAVAKRMQYFAYTGGESINIQGVKCEIEPFLLIGQVNDIKVYVKLGEAQTTVKAQLDAKNRSISNEEIL